MIIIQITLLLLVTEPGFGGRERPYINYKVVEVKTKTLKDLENILEHLPDLNVLERSNTPVPSLTAIVPPKDVHVLSKAVVQSEGKMEILDQNLQRSVDREFGDLGRRRRKRQASPLEETIKTYLNMQEEYQFQNRITSTCTKFANVKKIAIGRSTNNRLINVIRISSKTPGNRKTIFLEAGAHAREWLTVAVANYIIYKLACTREGDEMRGWYDWEILPVANPDGYSYTHSGFRYWRKNRQKIPGSRCVGTDLNRNFEAAFGGRGSSSSACNQLYRGARPYSAPETKALKDHVMSIRDNIASYVAVHAYGQYILLPWGYKKSQPRDYQSLMHHARAAETGMGLKFKIGTTFSTLYAASGISADFARDVAKVARSYSWELMPARARGVLGFNVPERHIPKHTSTAWRGMKAYIKSLAAEDGLPDRNIYTPYRQSQEPTWLPALWKVLHG